MPRILIIEGDTPELLKAISSSGRRSNAQSYADSLYACMSDVTLSVAHPYHPRFQLPDLNLADVDGVVFTGSNVDWSTDAPQAKPLREAMEQVFKAGIPTLGSCNGLQLAAVVLGGRVDASPNGLELGLARDIRLTPQGATHPLHRGRRGLFACPCVHRDQVSELPTGAVLTATNDHSPVQAMVYEREGVSFWGVQYHPEVSPGELADLVEAGGLFSSGSALAEALRDADRNPQGTAAQRLGAQADDLAPGTRRTELANWLTRVAART